MNTTFEIFFVSIQCNDWTDYGAAIFKILQVGGGMRQFSKGTDFVLNPGGVDVFSNLFKHFFTTPNICHFIC